MKRKEKTTIRIELMRYNVQVIQSNANKATKLENNGTTNLQIIIIIIIIKVDL
jgi:hypothetical protein